MEDRAKSKLQLMQELEALRARVAELESLERELRGTERTLRANEQRIRVLIHQLPAILWTTDQDLRITLSVGSGLAALGLAPNQVYGLTLQEYMGPGELTASTIDSHKRSLAGESLTYERQFKDRDFHTHIEPLRDAEGKIVGTIGVAQDVTDLKTAERALRDLLHLHHDTLNTIPCCLLVLDAALTVVMANEHFLGEQGVKPADVTGKSVVDVLPSSFISELSLLDRVRVVAKDGGHDEIFGVRCSVGSKEKIVNIRICSIRSGSSAAGDRVLLVVDDVTRERHLEDQLRQSQKLEAIGRLAGGVAHEFNNLLTGVLGYCDLLLGSIAPESSLRKDVEAIQACGVRGASLTHQMLAFGRRHSQQPRPIDLNLIVAEMERMLRRLIGEDVRLETSLDPALERVRADPARIEQVIINLVVNARDAMPNGGTISIRTANLERSVGSAEEPVSLAPGRWVSLSVADTGCGMDEETRARVFEPFFTTKAPGKGTGLGLSTVYGIVADSGGSVTVASEPGKGTTLSIYLPRSDAKDGDAGAPRVPPRAEPTGKTILLVEDEAQVRLPLRRLLETKGYAVLEAADGAEALEVARVHAATPIHLILCDVVMPGMPGTELVRRLLEERPDLRVLYISGYPDRASRSSDLERNGAVWLQKPFSLDALLLAVRELLA